jgi:hypothetical protein
MPSRPPVPGAQAASLYRTEAHVIDVFGVAACRRELAPWRHYPPGRGAWLRRKSETNSTKHAIHKDRIRLSGAARRSCATATLRRNPVISSRRRGLARRSAWCLYIHWHDSFAEHSGSGRLGAWADKKRVRPRARADAQPVGFAAIDTACQRSILNGRSLRFIATICHQ